MYAHVVEVNTVQEAAGRLGTGAGGWGVGGTGGRVQKFLAGGVGRWQLLPGGQLHLQQQPGLVHLRTTVALFLVPSHKPSSRLKVPGYF